MGESSWILVTMMGGNMEGAPLAVDAAHVSLVEPVAAFDTTTQQVREGWKLAVAGVGGVVVQHRDGLLGELGIGTAIQAALNDQMKKMRGLATQALLSANTQLAQKNAGQNGGGLRLRE
jgi:hypothetical protein